METLHNGIRLPDEWPPRGYDEHSLTDLPVPYLDAPPEVVGVDVGRQLFVDDFLIAETTLEKRYHPAEFLPQNPVLSPQSPLERSDGVAPLAAPFTDGCWFDPLDGLYKLWYHAGWMDGTCMAVSEDGLRWTKKLLDHQPGTGRIFLPPDGWRRDGSVIWLDADCPDPRKRYKLFHFFRTPEGEHGQVCTSRDGIHWDEPVRTGLCGDNTSFFYDPFRGKWVFSIRAGFPLFDRYSRARRYYAFDRFPEEARWQPGDDVFWQRCDMTDCAECMPGTRYSSLMPPQLYHLNAVGYESVLLGLFGIIKGFDEYDNSVCEHTGYPKHIDLHVGFSRDGFHFSRDFRAPFISCTDGEGDWNRGYLHACGGICLVDEDRLLFPVGGFSGESVTRGGHLYGGASTGMAALRRDGFVSLRANWSRQYVLTRPIRFERGARLFVNAKADEGYVAASVLDAQGRPIEGFGFEDCVPAQADATKQEIRFVGRDLSVLRGRPVRLRFDLVKSDLYAFWLSPDGRGASGGYVAAGGPSYAGARDL